MRNKTKLSIDLFGDRLNLSDNSEGEEDMEYRRMLRALRRAMEGELTERQKQCVRMRYLEGRNLRETAEELGVSPPTVSKHLKKARSRLGRVVGYSFSRLS